MSGERIEFDFDVFISHASEDKDSFARPLAEALAARGLRVWFDEWTLGIGDRLRRKIDEGLRKSRFGLVVLSPNFFAKEWPQRELDGLTALEGDGSSRILPVWLAVSASDVAQFSPTLADRLAARATDGIDKLVEQVVQALTRIPTDQPLPSVKARARLRETVDAQLALRNLANPAAEDFGRNPDTAELHVRERIEQENCGAFAVLSLVPNGEPEEIDGATLFDWASKGNWPAMHPLEHTDIRPRSGGVITRYRRHNDAPATRYAFVSGEGYVEWGRALGGGNGDVCVVRLGPLLWGMAHLYEFLGELRDKFALASDYELVVSIVNCKNTCLSHLGKKWLEPWDRSYRYYRPMPLDSNAQFRKPIQSPLAEQDRVALALELDLYLNRVWGDGTARGHDHPDLHEGRIVLSDEYKDRDPWE